MALKLAEKYQGINAEYWRINRFMYDDVTNTIQVHLWLYVNNASRKESLGNCLKREVIEIKDLESIDITGKTKLKDIYALLYPKIKESKKEKRVNPETQAEEEVETNKFVLAEDI